MKIFSFVVNIFFFMAALLFQLPTALCVELSLENAVQMALANNTNLLITQSNEDTAKAELRRAKGENGVTLSLSSSLDTNKSENSEHTESSTNRLSLSVPIYNGGKNRANIKSSELGVKSAELKTDRQREDLKLNVIQAYCNAVQDRETVDVRQEAVDNYEAHYDVVTQRYLAGDVARVDVIRASVELSNARYELARAQNNYATRTATLRNYLNMDRNEPLELTEAFRYDRFAIPVEDCVDYAHHKRKDLLVDLYSLKQKELAIKVAKSGYQPTVTLSVGTGFSGSTSPSWGMKHDVSGSISATWNIFDNGVTKAQVDSAKKEHDIARFTFEKDKEDIDLAIREAYHNMRGAESQLDSTGDAVAKAKADYYISGEKYKAGEGIMLDVLDAQKSLSDAQLNHISAQYDYLRYKATVENAMGIGLTRAEHVAAADLPFDPPAPLNTDAAIRAMEQSIFPSTAKPEPLPTQPKKEKKNKKQPPKDTPQPKASEKEDLSPKALPEKKEPPTPPQNPIQEVPPVSRSDARNEDMMSSRVLEELAKNPINVAYHKNILPLSYSVVTPPEPPAVPLPISHEVPAVASSSRKEETSVSHSIPNEDRNKPQEDKHIAVLETIPPKDDPPDNSLLQKINIDSFKEKKNSKSKELPLSLHHAKIPENRPSFQEKEDSIAEDFKENSQTDNEILQEPLETNSTVFESAGDEVEEMKSQTWKKMGIFLLLLAAGSFGAYQYQLSAQESKKETAIETIEVSRRDLMSTVSATGTIEPINSVAVSSRITARLKEVMVKENDTVTAGQIVAILDGKEYEVKRNKAEFNVQNTRLEYERVQRLHGIGAKSDKELQTATLNYNTAQSDLAEAESDLAETVIRAPMNGTVVGEPKTVGTMALQGSDYPTVIMRIADLSSKQIKAKIDETDIGNVSVGQRATFTVDAYTGKKFTARVSKISQTDVNNSWDSGSSNNSSGSSSASVVHYYVTLEVDDPEGLLLPAMTARVEIITKEKKDALALDISALQTDAKGSFVTLVHPDQSTEIRYIQTGIYSNDYVEILEGLSEGDRVSNSFAEEDDKKENESAFVF